MALDLLGIHNKLQYTHLPFSEDYRLSATLCVERVQKKVSVIFLMQSGIFGHLLPINGFSKLIQEHSVEGVRLKRA